MNSIKLDKKALDVISAAYSSIKSELTSGSKVKVQVTGWVQPTTKSPNISGLSRGRALAVVNQLKKLGLEAEYLVSAPGEDKPNTPQSRRATTVVTISTP